MEGGAGGGGGGGGGGGCVGGGGGGAPDPESPLLQAMSEKDAQISAANRMLCEQNDKWTSSEREDNAPPRLIRRTATLIFG